MTDTPDAGAPSLRRVLLGWLLVPLLALVPLAAAVLYLLAVRPALDALDRALTDTAVALEHILVERDGRVLPLSEQTEHALRADLVDQNFYVVIDADGGLIGGDRGLLHIVPALRRGQWSFFDESIGEVAVRVAAFGAACGLNGTRVCPILVAESLGKRHAAERAVLVAAIVTALALALVLASLAMFAVRRGLQPLRVAAGVIDSLTLDRLQPIDLRAAPQEVASFVRALNQLFGRLRVTADAQRAFVADAAHQLRTPLATIRFDAAQALVIDDAVERGAILKRLNGAAERGSRLVQQLLTLAHSDDVALARSVALQPVDLRAMAGAAADEWLAPSLAAGQDLGFDLAAAEVRGHPTLLRELLNNLVHNAIEHAGRGARITVRSGAADGVAFIEVEDDGPGIPPGERESVWERFRRGSQPGGTGSGLGLAIVRDIARLHGADAALRGGPHGRGLRVRVSFGSEPQPARVAA